MNGITLTASQWIDAPDDALSVLQGDHSGDVIIDLTGVDFVGGQVAQILVAAKGMHADRSDGLRFINVSPQLESELDLIGLASLFDKVNNDQ